MSGKQRLKLSILWTMRALGLFALARWITRHNCVIIGWHGVSLMGEHVDLPEYFTSPETLRRRLRHLHKHFKIVPLSDVIEQHAAGRFQPRQVALTFDDAMYNLLKAGVPVLRELDAPATTYVISSTLDQPSRANMLMLQYALLTSPLTESPEGLPELDERMPLTTQAERYACLHRLRERRFDIPQDEASYATFVSRLAEAFKVDFGEYNAQRAWDYMTADEIREFAAAGYFIQPHSHRHRNVTEILDTLAEDTRLCKERTEQVTGSPAVDYCYPSGDWSREAARILKESGIRSAVTCAVGHNHPRTPAFSLRRYMDGESFTQLEFEFVVSGLKWLVDSLRSPATRYETPEGSA